MMMVLTGVLRRWQRICKRSMRKPKLRLLVSLAGFFLLGYVFSAASLGNEMQPLPLGLLCAGLSGWMPVPFALGSSLGCWIHWGQAGIQGWIWIAAGLPVCMLGSLRKPKLPLLQPALAALIVSVSGVLFQLWRGENTYIAMFLLRILLASGSTWLFMQVRQSKDGLAHWIAQALLILALAQIAPLSFLDLGFVAAGILVAYAPFPAAALAGLALDLAQITPVPMTAVLALSSFARLLPGRHTKLMALTPALVYLPVMALSGHWDLLPLTALALGGLLGLLTPKPAPVSHRRGETGFAQVRLEMASAVLAQSEQLLLEAQGYPIDEATLIEKAADRACGCCPCRKSCKQTDQAKTMPPALLHRPLTGVDDLPMNCKKRGRLLLELRRAQDQFRILKADRDRQQEYRAAVIQQYQFLSSYLQDLADSLPRRGSESRQRFQPEVAVCSAGRELANGDRCLWFAGTQLKYYLLLCDGMGTGLGAAQEAKLAGDMLRRLLMAGFPAPYALRSLNSLCTLRGRAGAVTVDLAEIHLETGKVSLYKWGAAPSYLLVSTGPERIGTAAPPPGLSVTDQRETVDTFSLRKGEVLVMLTDGVQTGQAMASAFSLGLSPGALAARILEQGSTDGTDDATAAVVRLTPLT